MWPKTSLLHLITATVLLPVGAIRHKISINSFPNIRIRRSVQEVGG